MPHLTQQLVLVHLAVRQTTQKKSDEISSLEARGMMAFVSKVPRSMYSYALAPARPAMTLIIKPMLASCFN